MKIYITGVAGFLGSNLADYYINKGYDVIGCDNLIGGDRENVNDKVEFVKGDCEDLDLMTRTMNGVDVVCHAAAYAQEGLSNISPTLITSNNVTGSVSVFTAAIRNKVKRIVYCSSMARYGDVPTPYKEDDEPNPRDPYGVAKLASEKILKILCDTHGIEYNIAVPHNIIGPKQKYDDPFRNVVSIMINLILQNRQPIIYGDGNQTRCFSDIDDCIYCLDQLLLNKKIVSETVNIGPDEETISINQLYKILCNKLQYNKEAKYYPDRPNEVKNSYCSSEKARNILNYETSIKLDQSIDKIIGYIKSKGTKKFKYDYLLEIENDKTPVTWKDRIF